MADVAGKFFSAKKVRTGVAPSSPGVVVGDTPIPVNPPGSGGAADFVPLARVITINGNAQDLSADRTYNVGTVTSVGLTMPAAFTVANSPVTGAGTIGVTGAGTTAQYIRGDGSLATFPGLTGFVPYTGANQTVNLNTQQLQAGHTTLTTNGSTETLTVNHSSGSGIGLNITKAGNNEGLRVNKTSGSGNAATIIGTLEATTIVKTGGTAAQFLKADGTVDSNVYALNSALASYQLLSAKGQPNGYAGLDSNGKVPLAQINDALIGNVNFQGLWNAATNTPTLANPPAAGTKGYYYIVSTAGTFAGISFEVGDWIISNGSAWGKVDNTDAVSSVFGRTGNVTASNGDYNTSQVTENTNLYYTDGRSRAALSFVAGSGAYNSSTGVITIPTNNNQIANGANYITAAALGAYLPLAGGTLTGNLNGTTAAFSGLFTANRFANTFTSANSNSRNSFQSFNLNDATVQLGWIAADFGDTGTASDRVVLGSGYDNKAILGAHNGILTAWSTLYIQPDAAARVNIGATTDLGFKLGIQGTLGVTGAATFSSSVSVLNGSTITLFQPGNGNGSNVKSVTNGDFRVTTGGALDALIIANAGEATFSNTITAIQFIRSGGTSAQFLKADGSVDSNSYYLASNPSAFIALTAISGVAPIQYNNTTGAISITQASGSANGFLSSTDWNTFNNKTSNVGTVTSVAALTLGTAGSDLSSTVANGTTTPVITLNVPTASAANRGALSAADWTTFNGKQDNIVAGTTAQFYRGDKTFQTLNTAAVPELTNLYYTEARVSANTDVAANTVARHAAVTLGTANGLGLTGQQLSLALASGSANGALSSTDWTTFNNKQNALTNPVTGTGTTNFLPKFTGGSTIGNSIVTDNGSIVSVTNGTLGLSNAFNLTGRNAANTINIALIGRNSSDRVIIDADGYGTNIGGGGTVLINPTGGNAGIGTNAPTDKLQMNGGKAIFATSNFNGTTAGGSVFVFSDDNNGGKIWAQKDGNQAWGYLALQPAGGNVLIGTSTSIGSSILQVTGDARISNVLLAGGASNIDSSLAVQISSTGVGTQKYIGINKNGSYGLIVGYSETTGLSGVGAYIRQVTSDPLFFLVNNSLTALTLASTGAATFSSSVTATDVILGNGNNLTWGGPYGAGIPTIVGFNSELYFFPAGSTSGTTMRIFADGNVFIGNGASNSGFKLDVNGPARFSGQVNATSAFFSGTGLAPFNSGVVINNTTSAPALITFQNTANGHAFGFTSTGTQRFTFINGGLAECASISSTGAATFSSSVTASSIIRTGGTSSQYLMADGSVSTLSNPVTGTGTAGQVAYWSSGSAITGESNLFWDATNDRLGIGRNNPSQKLDVLGSGTVYVNIENSNANIAAVTTRNTSKTFHTGLLTDYWAVIDATSGSLTRLMITSGGNVLINTVTDFTDARLNVNGNIRTQNPTGGTAANWSLGTARGGTVTTNATVRVMIDGVLVDLVARYV